MDEARWRRLEHLCFEALELDRGERAEWLDRECGGDHALRMEVDRLIVAHDQEPGFLGRPLLDPASIDLTPSIEAPPPATIGSYQVGRLLGRGGMGEVYLATRESDGVHQSVAIKVVRPGMGATDILDRFRQERRILAGLDHPNIARLLDAGVTGDGRPYFVLEHVDGLPIDAYCDQRRLTIEARLALFQVVCSAVQHAHHRLVVHRDLKPSNILVTTDGVVKLLDFGIGKILDDPLEGDAAFETRSQVRLLTPDYAAPEQVTGGTITTASDVYSLGVLLYELLTGHHPYRTTGARRSDLERAILDTAPRRPSTIVASGAPAHGSQPARTAPEIGRQRQSDPTRLRRRLAGDLDNIISMALRKEPERRYPSASAFAEDLQRHLEGHPVRARPDTVRYRAAKFMMRNAGWVTAAGMALVALGTTTAVTLRQSRRVAIESARVAAERDKAFEVRSFLMEMFGASGASQSVGDTVTIRRLLDLQVASLDKTYATQPELKAEMLEVLADGYDRLGLIQDALPLAQAAVDLRRAHPETEGAELGPALNLLGWVTHESGRSAEAEPILREAIAVQRAAGPPQREGLARSLNDLGVVFNALARYPAADTVLTEAFALRLDLLGPDHRSVGITGNNLAATYYFSGRLPDAIRVQELAVEAIRRSLGPEHQRTVVAMSNLAAFRRTNGDWAGAESTFRELLAIQERVQGPDHPVTARTRTQVAQMLLERGMDRADSAALTAAESEYRLALGALERSLGADHPQVGVTLAALALVVSERGDQPGALALGERALQVLARSLGRTHPTTLPALTRLALVRWRLGQVDWAIDHQREAVEAYRTGAASASPDASRAEGGLCDFLLGRGGAGDAAEAASSCARAATALNSAPPGVRRNAPYVFLRLVQAYRALGRGREADSLLATVLPMVDSMAAPGGSLRLLRDSLASPR